MLSGLRRLKTEALHALRGSRLLAEAHGLWLLGRSSFSPPESDSRLEALLVAARRTTWNPARRLLAARVRPWLEPARSEQIRDRQIGMQQYRGDFGGFDARPVTFTRVLKAPGARGEKGVLYSAFEYNWVRLLNRPGARELLDRYYLIGASSWSPPDYALFAWVAGLSDDPLFMGISNLADVEAYRLMSPAIEPLPIMACDWIDPRHYDPKPRADRSIDILMVANWLPFKRHWLLFSALRTMRKDLRVVLVGREAPGRTADTIRDEARSFGVPQDLELRTGIGIDEVTRLQCDSRIACLFSRREGSCVAVVESFFADAPVAMMRDAHVGSKAYINERTGVLLTRHGLARQLSRFLERSDEFTPRQWALGHVTYEHSCRRLNDTLRERARRTGRPWTNDIVPICWRPYPEYVDAAAASPLADAVDELRDRYGIELEPGASPARAAAARLTTPEAARYTS